MSASAPADPHAHAAPLVPGPARGLGDASPGPVSRGYPGTEALSSAFTATDYRQALEDSNAGGRPLSLALRLPFCQHACYHCMRHPVLTTDRRRADAYLSRLDREMVLLGRHLGSRREVRGLHWGGGSPTFLTLNQMGDLIDRLDARFRLARGRDRDFGIEIDPRDADVLTLRHLEALGFNRLTLSVLDLDARVLQAINRPQSRGLTEQLLDEADRLGFRSLDMELTIGLPLQSREGFAATLEQILAMAPARLTLFPYLHRPERFPPQRHIPAGDLPGTEAQGAMRRAAHDRLVDAGYVHLGWDRYARQGGSLKDARAQWRRQAECDILGLGVGALSRLEGAWARNASGLADFEAALDDGGLPTATGRWLSRDDRLRAQAIEALMTRETLDLEALGQAFAIDAAAELATALDRLQAIGLVTRRGQRLDLVAPGTRWAGELTRAFGVASP
ncbi:radical SAM protein [Halomonas nitroreducens]|uniref:Oxygen-independent coproporphyrinogen III oxidase n=1 Tax=Halomonas nitroreducens TaxID=447425 RepID=A0A3S0K386_9GAMM|nr:radical SAM protein [Halomonas nitroreducens]RTR03773.1 radical SAM protein [Halomonas nitroreducens]